MAGGGGGWLFVCVCGVLSGRTERGRESRMLLTPPTSIGRRPHVPSRRVYAPRNLHGTEFVGKHVLSTQVSVATEHISAPLPSIF